MAVRVEIQGRAEGDQDRALDARAANDRVAERAQALQFRSRVPMLCECSSPDCHMLLMLSLQEYHEVRSDPGSFLTAPGHEIEGADLAEAKPGGYEVRRSTQRGHNGDGERRSA